MALGSALDLAWAVLMAGKRRSQRKAADPSPKLSQNILGTLMYGPKSGPRDDKERALN